jgi:hypothetical protein
MPDKSSAPNSSQDIGAGDHHPLTHQKPDALPETAPRYVAWTVLGIILWQFLAVYVAQSIVYHAAGYSVCGVLDCTPFLEWHIFGISYYRLLDHGYTVADATFFLSFFITSLVSYALFYVVRLIQTIIGRYFGYKVWSNKLIMFGAIMLAMELIIINLGISENYSRKGPSVMKGLYENTFLYFLMFIPLAILFEFIPALFAKTFSWIVDPHRPKDHPDA